MQPSGGSRYLASARCANCRSEGALSIDAQLHQDSLGGPWWDGRNRISTRELSPISTAGRLPILTPGCLEDGEVLALLDERGAYVIPQWRPFLRV